MIDEAVKSGKGLSQEVLEKVVPEMAKNFSVKLDEIAILHLIQNGNILAFLYPFKLQKVGSIPMTSTHCGKSLRVQWNGTPRRNPKNNGGSPNGVSSPAVLLTTNMKKTIK